MDPRQATILFDGDCGLCSGSVQWVAARDRHSVFRFVPLQSEAGRVALREHGLPEDFRGSNVLLCGGAAFTRSDAVLGVLHLLQLGWVAAPLGWIPRRWRDAVYDAVARNRHRLGFGGARCGLPGAPFRR